MWIHFPSAVTIGATHHAPESPLEILPALPIRAAKDTTNFEVNLYADGQISVGMDVDIVVSIVVG